VLDEINSKTVDKTKKKALKEGVPISLPEFDGEEVSLKVKSEDIKKTDQVLVSVAFLKDSVAINPTDFPKEDKAAQEVMHKVGVNLNKAVVAGQIEESNSALASLQKDFDKLIKDSTKLSESITKSNELIAKYNADNVKEEQKLSRAEADAASLEVIANSDAVTEKDMKKYSKAKSKASSIESTIIKNNQKVTEEKSKIKGAEMEQPMVRKQIEDLAAKIESQKELISQLQAKQEAIK
jgi:DNA repair exonuclease SbcCD ATPase subunit